MGKIIWQGSRLYIDSKALYDFPSLVISCQVVQAAHFPTH